MPPAPFSTSPLSGMDLGQILTDFLNEHRRCKLLAGSGGGLPLEIFLDFYSFKSPFQGFQVIQTGFQLGKAGFLLLKTYLLWKMWPISVKRWKPVWICTCLFPLLNSEDIIRKTWQWQLTSSITIQNSSCYAMISPEKPMIWWNVCNEICALRYPHRDYPHCDGWRSRVA